MRDEEIARLASASPDAVGMPADAGLVELRAMTSRFAALVADWVLDDVEIDELLIVPTGSGLRIANNAETAGSEAESRMRRAIELDALLRSALADADACRAWLRQPNPGIVGKPSPLAVICDGGGGLRALRDALRNEALEARVGFAR